MEINGSLIRQVWVKASPIHGQNPDIFRMDINGVWIRMKDYNNIDSLYGWTIYSLMEKESNKTNNLIPVHTHNNSIPLAGIDISIEKILGERFI